MEADSHENNPEMTEAESTKASLRACVCVCVSTCTHVCEGGDDGGEGVEEGSLHFSPFISSLW